MNLFELQQRANILVQKVNEYEASLTGTTIDEEATLNQHTYADLYCLRPVMKLLFGATLAEKLNRTLDNDLPLRVFASSAPAWNSTFNLLSYNPGNEEYKVNKNFTDYGYINSWEAYRVVNKKGVRNYGQREVNITFTTSDDVTTEQVLFNFTDTIVCKIKEQKVYCEVNSNGDINDIYMFDIKPNTTYNYTHYKRYTATLDFTYTEGTQPTVSKSIDLSGSFDSSYKYTLGCDINFNRAFLGTFNLTSTIYGGSTSQTIEAAWNSNASNFINIQLNSLLKINNGDKDIIYRYSGNLLSTSLATANLDFNFSKDTTGGIDTGEYFKLQLSFTLHAYSTDTFQILQVQDTLNNRSFGNLSARYNTSSKVLYLNCPGPSSYNTASISNCELNDIITLELYGYVETNGAFRYNVTKIFKNYTIVNGAQCIGAYNNFNNAKLQFNIGPKYSINYAIIDGFILEDVILTAKRASYDVGYQSNQHEFMNNIDMYNNYNMCQLDVTQNSVTNKDTRIPLGINYSYSANIADALVTECQVANIFNWNTTTSTQIANNTISINRQVPGIVCYYLGNGYNSTFTATIPYSPRLDNINSINYGTPPYYGAFYRNGSEIEISQVGLQMGAEACRIFMPGLNYTRGKLESPQQIWQPEKLVGDNNIDKGFNWQGRAIYHELVFKNRRAGSSDAGVDFKPTLDNVADNDPQGLATRFALAQQKPYYYNRPWFKELDELYGADPTKLVNYINNNSVIIPDDKDRIVLADFVEAVGTPDIDENGIYSNITTSNYLKIADDRLKQIGNEFVLKIKTASSFSGEGSIYCAYPLGQPGPNITQFGEGYNHQIGTWTNSPTMFFTPQTNTNYWLKVKQVSTSSLSYSYSTDGTNWTNGTGSDNYSNQSQFTYALLGLRATSGAINIFSGSIDLLNSGIIFNGTTEMIPFATKQSGTKSIFDKSLFTLTGAVNLSDDGILSPITPTTGATIINENSKLDINTNKSFEVYSPRIYTSSHNGTPFKLEADNNGYIEAKVAFEADKVAASVSCQLLNFLVFDLSVYITQADINWVQFKFVNDITSKTFKAYAMSDKSVDNWQLINEGAVTTDENPAIYIINNYKLGFMDSDTDNKKLDLTSIKLILEGETLFSSMSTPGAQPMNDTEFYNQYKLDYNTWANALNKPL